ncbi:MAG TPA: cytochrome b [Micavibrio sp.]
MIWRNTAQRYGAIAQGFHWVVAVLVLGMLGLGLYMDAQEPTPAVFKLYALHKSIGVSVLILAVLRLCWKLSQKGPLSLPTHAAWERVLAKVTHFFLYFSMMAMPLSGWVMSSAKNFPVSVFDLFTLPALVGPDPELARMAVQFHCVVAWLLIAAIALHVAGALKHHIIDRDGTLRRMIPGAFRNEV